MKSLCGEIILLDTVVDRDNALLSFEFGWCSGLRMGILSFLSLPPCAASSISATPRCIVDAKNNKISILTVEKYYSRRLILQFMSINQILYHATPALAAAPIMDMNEPQVIRTLKLANGVRVQDVIEGEGPEAHGGDLVEFNYVCRRANGYFVFSTVDQFSGESNPVILPLDEDEMILGLKQVLTGMKIGGKRRALIPPSVGYVNENLKPIPEEFGPRRSLLSHAQEPLVFEVQLLKILSTPQQSE
ncbi:FKBP peptidyl-prolyl cis-trans isomerase family protein [Trifolium repens]|nr:FKBP peptidyl-prolyl cis-trans isomerase family protein [Trifolium repens]